MSHQMYFTLSLTMLLCIFVSSNRPFNISFRRDLEEVRRQIGLDGNISDILDQFGASQTGKISYSQFANKSSLLFGDLNHSGSESSPEYFTDSDTQLSSVPPVTMEKGRSKKEESRKGMKPDFCTSSLCIAPLTIVIQRNFQL